MQFMFSRKSGIVLAALLGVQLILPASGWALTGRDVALKADHCLLYTSDAADEL